MFFYVIENKNISQPVNRCSLHLSYEAVIRQTIEAKCGFGHWKIEENFYVSKLRYFLLNTNYFPTNDIEPVKNEKQIIKTIDSINVFLLFSHILSLIWMNIMNSNKTIDANHYTSLHKMHVQLVHLLLNQMQYFTVMVSINSINVQI